MSNYGINSLQIFSLFSLKQIHPVLLKRTCSSGSIYFKAIACLICLLHFTIVKAQQARFSLSTDFSVLRSLKKQQHFWTVGQTVSGHFHFSGKNEAYLWFTYYNNGKFNNNLTAEAKLPATTPQQIGYTNGASMDFRHLSIGWKHYIIGASNSEDHWNLYGSAGFGLMMGRISNTLSTIIDTSQYTVPVTPGNGHFKRLTLDLCLGYEVPVGGDIFVYLEGRTLIPTTDYPSSYLSVNKDAPLTVAVNIGFRILFD